MSDPQPPPHLAAVSLAIERAERAHADCEEASAALRDTVPGEAFTAAWRHYERRRAAFDLAFAEVRTAIEDAHAVHPD